MAESSDDHRQHSRHWLDYAAVWAASAAAFAAAIAASAGAWQGWIANQGVAESKKANELASRPYIKIDLLPETFAIGPVPKREGAVMSVQFTLSNTGKLPAGLSVVSSTDWDSAKHHLDKTALRGYGNIGRRFLFPEQDSGRFTIYTGGLSDGEIVDLKANTSRHFYVRIMALYGPDEKHLMDRFVLLCNSYEINWDGQRFSLGPGEPDPGDNEHCNYAD